MKRLMIALCFASLFGFAQETFAKLEHGGGVNHSADQVFAENITITTQSFTSEAVYSRDLTILGGTIFMNGYVVGDLLSAAKKIEVNGEIEGDVRVLGGSVVLSGIVHGDVLVFGGEVETTERSQVLGETIILGGSLIHEGDILGETKIISGKVVLDGEFGSDLTVTTQELITQPGLVLNTQKNNLYYAPREALLTPEVAESLRYNQTSAWYKNKDFRSTASAFFGFWTLLKFITSGLLIFLMYFVFKDFIERIKQQGSEGWLKSGIVGLIAIFALPTLSILLIVSLIGLPIGILLMLLFWSLLVIRISLTSFILSVWLRRMWAHYTQKKFSETNYQAILWALIALIILSGVGYIPYVGSILVNGLTLVALGATLIIIYKSIFRRY